MFESSYNQMDLIKSNGREKFSTGSCNESTPLPTLIPAPNKVRPRSVSLTDRKSAGPVVRPRSVSSTLSPSKKLFPPAVTYVVTVPTHSAKKGDDGHSSSPGVVLRQSQSPGGNTTGPPPITKTEDGPGDGVYPWLYDDATRYMECLDEFQRFSDEWVGVQGWIEEHLAKLVELQDLNDSDKGLVPATADCTQQQPSDGTRRVYRMLGVGSGSGEVDRAILRVLLPRHPRVSTTVVEPDPSQVSLYRQLVDGSEFHSVSFEFHQQTSSDFIAENPSNNLTYDLIHMVHVLYHIDMAELEATILHYYNSLGPGGMMFITYESDKSSLARIRGALQPFKPGMPPYMSIADIEKVLSRAVPAYQRDNIPGTLDVTACLRGGPRSASREQLWDFITRVVNFRANAPQAVVQRAEDMLREFSWQDGVGDGRFLTNTDTTVIIVQRQK